MNIEIQKLNTPRSAYEKWTPSSIFCYERKCKCDGCLINELLETKCKMKVTVLLLVANLGVPTKEQINSIDVIQRGAENSNTFIN